MLAVCKRLRSCGKCVVLKWELKFDSSIHEQFPAVTNFSKKRNTHEASFSNGTQGALVQLGFFKEVNSDSKTCTCFCHTFYWLLHEF